MFSIENSGEVTSGKPILSRTVVANVKPPYTQEYNSETGERDIGHRFFSSIYIKRSFIFTHPNAKQKCWVFPLNEFGVCLLKSHIKDGTFKTHTPDRFGS